MSEFVGARLALARAFQHVTLTKLADTVSVSFGLLGHYEKGLRKNPRPDLVAALAQALEVQPRFFFEPLDDPWREEQCSFRRRASTPEGIKRRARAHGTLIDLVLHELATMVRIPTYAIPSIEARDADALLEGDSQLSELLRHQPRGLLLAEARLRVVQDRPGDPDELLAAAIDLRAGPVFQLFPGRHSSPWLLVAGCDSSRGKAGGQASVRRPRQS